MLSNKELKEFIISDWIKSGLSYSDVKDMIKKADSSVLGDTSDLLFKTFPALAFGIPMVGASAYALMLKANKQYENMKKRREDAFKEQINENFVTGE